MDYKVNKGSNLGMSLTFIGAVGGHVTGSRSLLEIRRRDIVKYILIDYGTHQGEDEELNLTQKLPIPAEKLDTIIITHSHADHIGHVPELVKEGFEGKIMGSQETLDQGAEILMDSAILNAQLMRFRKGEIEKMDKLAKREMSRAKKKDVSRKEMSALLSFQEEIEEEKMVPYLPEDAKETIQRFVPIPINEEYTICEGIYVKLIPISHINGSTIVEVYATHGAEKCAVAFSCDIGRDNHPLYKEIVYEQEPDIDILVMESLHGFKEEDVTYKDTYEEQIKIFQKAYKKRKKVMLVVFAQDRSALKVAEINEMRRNGYRFGCYFDTPLGMKLLFLYIKAYKTGNSAWFDYDKPYPFDIEHVNFARDYQEHMDFVRMKGPFIGIISSGMGYGGRVVDYFEHLIQDKDAIFVFPEFLPEDCPSKKLCNAAKGELVEMYGNTYVKQCETIQLDGNSGHGYRKEKLKIINRYCNAKVIFLNHGDNESIEELYEELPNYTRAKIIVPAHNDSYDLIQLTQEENS